MERNVVGFMFPLYNPPPPQYSAWQVPFDCQSTLSLWTWYEQMKIRFEMCAQRTFSEFSQDETLREGVKEKWECFWSFWGCRGGGGVDRVPQSTLRRGRGNKGVLFSLSVLAGRLFSALSCSIGGVMQGYARGDLQKKVWCWSLCLNTQLFLLKRAGEAVLDIDSLGPTEALPNFGWAADVGEVVWWPSSST